jgi:uncharacterized membrane protein
VARQPTLGRFQFQLRELLQTLWVRVAFFAVLGLLTALAAFLLRRFIPDSLAGQVGANAIGPILHIIASSMLTITTFSLSILTAAYATASSGSTPRAVQLLVRDGVSQTVLATFMGAFVFSLVGLIMLNTSLYGEGGRIVLFVVTLLVILIVLVSLLRWIHRLEELGLIGDTLSRIEATAREALAARLASPFLGANPLRGPPPSDAATILSPMVGYVQNCDMQALSSLAEESGSLVYLAAQPGDLVHLSRPLFHVGNMPSDPDAAGKLRESLIACVTVRPTRSFDQDPRFAFVVMSEIGQRALSPAINDPGTAIAVTVRLLRVLSPWQVHPQPDVDYPRLYVPAITTREMLQDTLLPLARDGAGMVEVQRAIQDCLLSLTRIAPEIFGEIAASLSADALAYAREGLRLPRHTGEIEDMSHQVQLAAGRVVP